MPDPDKKRLLILGGTAEAAELAERAISTWGERLHVITSLAGRVSAHRNLPGVVRVGGFGGVDGLIKTLREDRIDWLIDATHPFAETISAHAYDACLIAEVPRLTLLRAPWIADPRRPWIEAESGADAASMLPRIGRRVFLTIGSRGLEDFAKVEGAWFLVRVIEPPRRPLSLPDHKIVVARPPHSVEDEVKLMEENAIDLLISKQSGGSITDTKIVAANRLGVGIVMIRRPLAEPGPTVETVDEALAWIESVMPQSKK